jgi:hypothetical protein
LEISCGDAGFGKPRFVVRLLHREFDAIAPLVLCRVQGCISASHQTAEVRRGRLLEASDSEAGGDAETVAANSELLNLKLLADAFDDNLYKLFSYVS